MAKKEPGTAAVQKPTPAPRYFRAPQWGPARVPRGGTYVRVTLGPEAVIGELSGRPQPRNRPKALISLVKEHLEFRWAKGHLLVPNLGGPDDAPFNLFPQTRACYYEMRGIWRNIISALNRARQHNDRTPQDPVWYGIQLVVTVEDQPFRFAPAAPRSIRVSARPVHMNKDTESVQPSGSSGPPLNFSAISGRVIRNRK